MRSVLEEAGHTKHTIAELPGLNHLFQVGLLVGFGCLLGVVGGMFVSKCSIPVARYGSDRLHDCRCRGMGADTGPRANASPIYEPPPLQTCETGQLTEYGALEETFAPSALAMVSGWIKATTGLK